MIAILTESFAAQHSSLCASAELFGDAASQPDLVLLAPVPTGSALLWGGHMGLDGVHHTIWDGLALSGS